jgi:uncharacterized membrane protein YjgN (DUF898 family)
MNHDSQATPGHLHGDELAQNALPAASPNGHEPGTRKLSIAFTGSGSEYFRIWIVNLLLTVVTLGLYFPWAKVRRLQYFYGNTLVDGEPLGFHGNAFKMFKGFAIVAAFVIIYSVAGKVSQIAGLAAFLVMAGLWPALLKSSLQFRLANTSWRGLRFGFAGSTKDAYRACLPLFVPGLLFLGLFLIAPELQSLGQTPQPSASGVIAYGLVMLCTVLISPWLMWNFKNYQHSHYRFSTETSRFNVRARSYFLLSLKSVGVMFLIYIALILAFVAIFGAAALANGSAGMPKGRVAIIIFGLAGVVFATIAFPAIKLYPVVRFQNLVWNGTCSGNIKFASTLRIRDMAVLTLKNWILMLLTLGFYWPFAAVAMTRLRLTAVYLESSISPAALMLDRNAAEGQAIGDAAGDFFGFDIGL